MLALVVACLTVASPSAFGGASGAPEPAGVPTRVTTTTLVPCAFWNQQLSTDWYLPPAAPIGLLYAQHGLEESRNDWADFAMSAAAAGFIVFVPTLPTANLFGCTVQNLGNNTRFLTNIATLFARADDVNGALATSFAAARALADRAELTLPTNLAIIGHSVGGEAALYVASQLTGAGKGVADLRGIVLADPVRSLVGGNLAPALQALAGSVVPGPTAAPEPPPVVAGDGSAPTAADQEPGVGSGPTAPVPTVVPAEPVPAAPVSAQPVPAEPVPAVPVSVAPVPLPILVLAAPAQSCNAQQSGTRAVISGLPDRTFIGAAITTGSHADIFGRSVNKVERLTCGLPRQVNIDATRTLAIGWLTDAVTGTPSAGGYPGGAGYDALISRGIISTLR